MDANSTKKYEKIGQKATQIMLSAENNCTPKFKTLQTWSTKMRDTGLKTEILPQISLVP